MKKQLLFTAALFMAGTTLTFAQITNGGFENWAANGTCSDPVNWTTANNAAPPIVTSCVAFQETSAFHGGTSSIRLVATQTAIATFPGIATNGTLSVLTQSIDGGQAFTERPVSFSGWYQATPQAGDEYSFTALLINETTGDTVGIANFNGTSVVSTWTEFTAEVNYTSSDNPTYVQIILLSSNLTAAVAGSVAMFDDLDYQLLAVGVNEQEIANISTYPNPVTDQVTFNLGNIETANLEIFNVVGKKIHDATLSNANRTIDMSSFAKGTYVWRISELNGAPLKSGKLLLTN